MAINYTVSFTFSPNTTIQSSQVNTNTSDNANTWTGLEALTKTFAKLKVDVDPATSLEVATKQYVDHYASYRRPVLQYNSATVVNVETGIDGTSGDLTIQFPDGTKRTDTTAGRIQCNLAQVAALSGSWQSGLRTGSAAANTWYSFYAVKTTDDSAKIVIVADTVIPTRANYATLNSNFGTNGWVYLGVLPYGDNKGATTAIPTFVMAGNTVMLTNACVAVTTTMNGVLLIATAGATTLNYTYSAGTALGSGQIPGHLTLGWISSSKSYDASGRGVQYTTALGDRLFGLLLDGPTSATNLFRHFGALSQGLLASDYNSSTGNAYDILLEGYVDPVLGVGSNPLL